MASSRRLAALALSTSSARWMRRRGTPEVGGTVDYRLDAKGPALLQILLDAGVLVERVDGYLGPAGDHLGGEFARRVLSDLAVEDELDLVGSTDIEIVGHGGFEDGTGTARGIEYDGVGHLDLAHRKLPPVPGGPVGSTERGRDDLHPAFEE